MKMADDEWRAWTNDEGKKWEFKVDLIWLWHKLFGKKEKKDERISGKDCKSDYSGSGE